MLELIGAGWALCSAIALGIMLVGVVEPDKKRPWYEVVGLLAAAVVFGPVVLGVVVGACHP